MKIQALLAVVLIILVAVLVAGCAVAPTEVAPREEELSVAQGQSDQIRELEEVTMTPVPTLEPAQVTPPPEAEAVVKLAADDLTQRLSLAPGAIQLVSVEAVEWSDASLGCPQPGMMYAQVITPGYLLVMEAGGEQYTYHTDMDRFVVLCEEGGETSGTTSGATPPGEPAISEPQDPFLSEMVAQAKQDLANRLSVELDRINLLEVREVTWPDSSLGCPQPGMAYAQAPQEGLLIRLGVDKDMYFYHSGEAQVPFLCEGTSQVVPKVTPKVDEFVPPPDSEID
jgi:hypothetical protein